MPGIVRRLRHTALLFVAVMMLVACGGSDSLPAEQAQEVTLTPVADGGSTLDSTPPATIAGTSAPDLQASITESPLSPTAVATTTQVAALETPPSSEEQTEPVATEPVASPTVPPEPTTTPEPPAEPANPAPELGSIDSWHNSVPLSLDSLRGAPVLLVFWADY